jgi:hypothetical protein
VSFLGHKASIFILKECMNLGKFHTLLDLDGFGVVSLICSFSC